MDLEKAYNKIDNLCCVNHMAVTLSNMSIDKGVIPNKIDFFNGYNETHDDSFCKDTKDMVEALETIKEVVNLQKEIGCPLDVRLHVDLGTPIYIEVRRDKTADISVRNEDGTWTKITGDKMLVKTIVISDMFSTTKSKSFVVSRPDSIACDKYENRERRLFWSDYKKTWWLKEDKSK